MWRRAERASVVVASVVVVVVSNSGLWRILSVKIFETVSGECGWAMVRSLWAG